MKKSILAIALGPKGGSDESPDTETDVPPGFAAEIRGAIPGVGKRGIAAMFAAIKLAIEHCSSEHDEDEDEDEEEEDY